MELRTLVLAEIVLLTIITVTLLIMAYLDWKRFQYDRQRHDEALLERSRRKEEKETEKATRRQENATNRLFSAASEAASQSRFSLEDKKPEVARATKQGGWDGVVVSLPSSGQWGTEIASAFVRCAPKGDDIVVTLVGHRDPLTYHNISHLEKAAGALTALVRNYPHQ